MLIEILRQTSIAGRPARVGDVVDVAAPDAAYLVATGKAEQVIDQHPAMEPAPEVRQPRPRKPPAKD
jgi:hypothetical protein